MHRIASLAFVLLAAPAIAADFAALPGGKFASVLPADANDTDVVVTPFRLRVTPVTNAEFMRELRAALHRPWCPAAPEFIVDLFARHALKTDASLALHGQRAVPARLAAAGFTFKFPAAGAAIRDLLAPGTQAQGR